MDSSHPDFWNERFESGDMPWDIGGVPERLVRFLAAAAPGSVLIPGCGSGYEIGAFADAGWRVTAIDFAPLAVEGARKLYGREEVKIDLGDFFTFDFGGAPFDLVYERRFLCAICPKRWEELAGRVAGLLKPGGKYAGIFMYGESDPDGPPFPMTEAEMHSILGAGFELAVDDDLGPSRLSSGDRWQEWKKK